MNLFETGPLSLIDRVTALESALTTGDIATTALPTPSTPVVTNVGTAGSTSNSYVVAAVADQGMSPSAVVANTTCNATLSATNYAKIAWTSIVGQTYNVYRPAANGTPSTTGYIGVVVATTTSSSFNDTGIAATGNTPTTNTTGCLSPAGPVFAGAQVFVGGAGPQTLSTALSINALTVAHISNKVLTRGGSPAGTDTMPTAAALVAAYPGIKANSTFDFYLRNKTAATITVAVGSGGTADSGNTMTVVSLHVRKFIVSVTNVTPASEAYTCFSGPDSAL